MISRLLPSCCAALLLWGAIHVPRAAAADTKVFALVIGNNQPTEAGVRALRYADDDARATYELLREAGVFSLALVRMDAMTREQHRDLNAYGLPRGAVLDRALRVIRDEIRAVRSSGNRAEFMVFYSG